MVGWRFDRITRVWGADIDRRVALHQVATVLLALGAWGRSDRAAAAQDSRAPATCGSDEDCTSGLAACTGAICLKGTCQLFVADCLPGDICCGNGSCCPDASPIVCLADADARWGAMTPAMPCAVNRGSARW
jgi:hypothetical protein